MCYKCDHVAHPRDCDKVVECKAGEVRTSMYLNHIRLFRLCRAIAVSINNDMAAVTFCNMYRLQMYTQNQK